jgi:tRNA (mo5U34)-methyltransferase
MIASSDAEAARRRIAELDWWHTIEVVPGVVTPGGWDLRGTADALPWPAEPLNGLRCLDIGTMDGFWAFELERRGAREVVAGDVLDAARLDRFMADRLRGPQHRRPSERNFALATELRGSRIELRDLNVYELDPDDVGEFDLVVMGYVLQMLRDPLRGLEAMRRVCRGRLILLDTVSRPLELVPAPRARLDARRDGSEWFVFNRRGLRRHWSSPAGSSRRPRRCSATTPARESARASARCVVPCTPWASAAAAPPSGLGRSTRAGAEPRGPDPAPPVAYTSWSPAVAHWPLPDERGTSLDGGAAA